MTMSQRSTGAKLVNFIGDACSNGQVSIDKGQALSVSAWNWKTDIRIMLNQADHAYDEWN